MELLATRMVSRYSVVEAFPCCACLYIYIYVFIVCSACEIKQNIGNDKLHTHFMIECCADTHTCFYSGSF